jgi:hypothetical protein
VVEPVETTMGSSSAGRLVEPVETTMGLSGEVVSTCSTTTNGYDTLDHRCGTPSDVRRVNR